MSRAGKKPTRPSPTQKGAAGAIDRDKLRTALRNLHDESIFHMLVDAIDLLPPNRLAKLVAGYLDVKQLRPDALGRTNLLVEIRAFDASSRAGKYYEGFNVNSKNYMETSKGTRAFIDDCGRFLDRCVTESKKGDAAEIREAIELVLGLLRHIDDGNDDIVFFADEGGSWQVGVEWTKVLSALFSCLSRTTEPDDYARRVVEVVDEFAGHDRAKHIAAAQRGGTAAQRKALRTAAKL